MKRFVDIRGQGIGYRFSFWDTSVDRFMDIDGTQAWDGWDDFSEDVRRDGKGIELQRYRGLCPEWVFDGGNDDIDSFWEGQGGGEVSCPVMQGLSRCPDCGSSDLECGRTKRKGKPITHCRRCKGWFAPQLVVAAEMLDAEGS
jgi:hypothetical protein